MLDMERQQLEDFLALIAMQFRGAYDEALMMDIRERSEAREAQRNAP